MKKVIFTILIFTLAISFFACSGKNNQATSSSSGGSGNSQAAESTNNAPAFIAGVWPNNEWTAQLPKPNAGTVGNIDTLGARDQTLSIKMDWTRDEAVEYAKEVRANGFNRNVLAYYEDSSSLSTLLEAENSSGFELSITTSEIRIVKP